MFARREAVLSAGLFDERFFLYSEEPDLCLRIKRAGWSIRHLPAMTILHHAGKAGMPPQDDRAGGLLAPGNTRESISLELTDRISGCRRLTSRGSPMVTPGDAAPPAEKPRSWRCARS